MSIELLKSLDRAVSLRLPSFLLLVDGSLFFSTLDCFHILVPHPSSELRFVI